MAYDELLADKIRIELDQKKVDFEEKKMFGGLCFMVDDKMCVGIIKDELMARVDPEIFEEALGKPGARPMDFTKRPMKGYINVEPEGIEENLGYWVDLCLEFNPRAKSSKKKKK
jgi:TfoX/Sxy family transcriptional regulator of competence genes